MLFVSAEIFGNTTGFDQKLHNGPCSKHCNTILSYGPAACSLYISMTWEVNERTNTQQMIPF